MKNIKNICKVIAFFIIVAVVWSCATVPLTGRRQLSLVSDSEIMSMSRTQYNQFLQEHQLAEDREQREMIDRVGNRIASAVEEYFRQNGLEDQLSDFQWEFNLIEDNTPNAWAMPGGKVVFYTGILPITQNEEGVAVVMGHEIAHVVARHGSERMSQQMGIQFGGMALSALLSEKPQETQNLWMSAYGITSQVGMILPYSRRHEYEADELGLKFMAMAGYDPSVAVDFWKRMSSLSDGGSNMAFLSTHPANDARVRNIQSILPEAMQYYRER
ncbi:M48 family metallopeptidase [Marinilabiliaceae bacterium ANBcel2]|nr:M48 family metallopeptidase [Marinilabiliaceae bacterium ANBcel2]